MTTLSLYLLIVIIFIISPFPKLNYDNYFNYFHITFSPHSLIFFPSLIGITHVNVYECPTSWNLYDVYVLQGDQLDKPCFSGNLKKRINQSNIEMVGPIVW